MKVFVGFGYNDRDKWVPDLVFSIIRAFGDEVMTGEDQQGEQITDAVRLKIQQSTAFIGFATRRDQIGEGKWTTHRWVTDEMALALAQKIPVVEVREQGVDDQGGILGDRQRIVYDENQRDKCLVELVKTIGKWHQVNRVKLQLLPDEYAHEIFPLLRKEDLRCTYRLLSDGMEQGEIATKVVPIKGGLFIEAKDVPRDALIQVHVRYQGTSWISSFESIDSLGIRLQKG
jgi:hypothetical protein